MNRQTKLQEELRIQFYAYQVYFLIFQFNIIQVKFRLSVILLRTHFLSNRTSPKFADKHSHANSVDPDQTPRYAASDLVYAVCHSSSSISDTSGAGQVDSFKF